MPIVLSNQGHHRPVQGRVGGVDRDELFGAVLGEPVHPNGVAHGIGQEEHFHLGKRANGFAAGSHPADAAYHLLPLTRGRQPTAQGGRNPLPSPARALASP